jgi:hypothetical protein
VSAYEDLQRLVGAWHRHLAKRQNGMKYVAVAERGSGLCFQLEDVPAPISAMVHQEAEKLMTGTLDGYYDLVKQALQEKARAEAREILLALDDTNDERLGK